MAIKVGNAAVGERPHAWSGITPGETEHRAGGAFIRRPHRRLVLGLAAFHARSLGATSIYSRSVLSMRAASYGLTCPTARRCEWRRSQRARVLPPAPTRSIRLALRPRAGLGSDVSGRVLSELGIRLGRR